ncbi:hypothetical protein BCR34DRAFT_657037 [Clohesyomyces aquaticus]|uniref:Uncharacterized protein n=1 Tax=Clohesyomyces aquaticus TaxID=1231657 RepID=A0A1Y1ZHA0_9PLEO|nr:hypothetical protein BCR34DRAFT_657037 [Clohesyomyces aquaticus]
MSTRRAPPRWNAALMASRHLIGRRASIATTANASSLYQTAEGASGLAIRSWLNLSPHVDDARLHTVTQVAEMKHAAVPAPAPSLPPSMTDYPRPPHPGWHACPTIYLPLQPWTGEESLRSLFVALVHCSTHRARLQTSTPPNKDLGANVQPSRIEFSRQSSRLSHR